MNAFSWLAVVAGYLAGALYTFRLTLRWMFEENPQVTRLDVLWEVLVAVAWPVFLPIQMFVVMVEKLRRPVKSDWPRLREWVKK